jgi:hypothetical protein
VTVENLRNEMRSFQDQVNLLDKQIEKDREKLLKLTEDKKVLLEKVNSIFDFYLTIFIDFFINYFIH